MASIMSSSALTDPNRLAVGKTVRGVVVSVSGISTPSSNARSSLSEDASEQRHKIVVTETSTRSDEKTKTRKDTLLPSISQLDKLREYARIGSERAQASFQHRAAPYEALSAQGKFAHTYIAPFFTWWQKTTTVQGICASTVEVMIPDRQNTKTENVVNGLSQNYAGFYKLSPQSESLQHEALERLPIADASRVSCLLEATEAAIAEVFDADFCVTTATGYASNYIALPALVNENTLIVLDSDCHNSLLTGAYLAQPAGIRKFAHNDASSLEKILSDAKGRYESTLVVVEGLYSMEGDTPPLDELSKLKNIYDFILLCDEAHSFYSIGSTGRGCLQYWNETHPDSPMREDLIDIRTCTLSKAIGGVGGVICGKMKFKPAIINRLAVLKDADLQTLSTSQMIQVLWVHGQPTRNARHLHRLADMARFCRSELKNFGIYVYGEDASHILPIHAGRLTLSTRLSHKLREKKLLGVPLSAPAVPFWQSRIRLNLSAAHTDDEVNILLDAVIDGCRELGISKNPHAIRRRYQYACNDSSSEEQEKLEASRTYERISKLTAQAIDEITQHGTPPQTNQAVRHRGQQARQKHGLGSGGSRFFLTFPPHLDLEAMIAKHTSTEACMTFPDAHIGLASTIAALSRSLLGYDKHYLCLPEDMPVAVRDGTVIAARKGRPDVAGYRDLGGLVGCLRERKGRKKTYFTVYLRVEDPASLSETVAAVHEMIKGRQSSTGMTILIDATTFIPEAAALQPLLNQQNIQVLVAGSFHKMFRLPGSFVSGSKVLVDELRACSRGYMFTTSTQPFMMEMIKASLEDSLLGAM